MKHLSKIMIAFLLISMLASLLAVHVAADTIYTQDGFYYTRSSSTTAELYGRESTDADLVIPKSFSERYVTEIADSAFEGDQNIETLTFEQATLLEKIGYYAFQNCENLDGEVNFIGRINTIGVSAFENCRSLKSVVFNSYVVEIPDQCFYNCVSLNNVKLGDRITKIGKFAFGNCASLKEITIPDNVTDINQTAFSGCEDLVIYCNTDSYAHQYALDNGFDFILLDAPVPTDPPTEPPTETATDPQTEPMTEEPSKTPVEVTFKIGDADGDGEITILDATKIQRYLVGLDTDDMIAIRGISGEEDALNIIHATRIQRDVAGFESSYHIGEPITRTIYI